MKADNFSQEDLLVLQTALELQLQNHFKDLVKAIPGIKEFIFKCSQEDENLYALSSFELSKQNGYKYEYSFMERFEPARSEFTEKELFLLDEFINYLEKSSKLFFIIFGYKTCVLTAD